MARELHVSIEGSDQAAGTLASPLRSIGRAAGLAGPGDRILVHPGLYREAVRPARSGTDDAPITFEAAGGGRSVISGAERLVGWQPAGNGTWLLRRGIPASFGTVLGGDWFDGRGRTHRQGQLFLDGAALAEAAGRDEVIDPAGSADGGIASGRWLPWWVGEDAEGPLLLARFGGADPNAALVEASVRETCFTPAVIGIDCITVRGFELRQVANPWAPPTAGQIGIIGPHWSRGWVIEDNRIADAACCGISLGRPGDERDNAWTRWRQKHGSQLQREAVFTALAAGWNRDRIGSHCVRRNEILRCGQAGIIGHLGCAFSRIEGNHVHDIHQRDAFGGAEIAGIKFHAAIDTRVADNRIHRCGRGLWLDWQAQGARVTGNLIYDNHTDDLFIEVCHGPLLVDHNLLLSEVAIRNIAQGSAFVHNLVAGQVVVKPMHVRFTPYHFPHRTEVAGVMTINTGDDRFIGNLFCTRKHRRAAGIAAIDNGDVPPDANAPTQAGGLAGYDQHPTADETWNTFLSPGDFCALRLPVHIRHNAYGRGAIPWVKEVDPLIDPEQCGVEALDETDGRVELTVRLPVAAIPVVDAAMLGRAHHPDAAFEDPDGAPADLGRDYFARQRSGPSLPGPFAALEPGSHRLTLWPKADDHPGCGQAR